MPFAATVYLFPEPLPWMCQGVALTTILHTDAACAVAAWEPVTDTRVVVARRIETDVPTAAARRSLVELLRGILNILVPL
jgi:hypothetical protein